MLRARLGPDSIVHAETVDVCHLLDFLARRHQRVKRGERALLRGLRQIGTIENFWSQARRNLRKYNGVPPHHCHLFLKECEWRFNYGSPRQLRETLVRSSRVAAKPWRAFSQVARCHLGEERRNKLSSYFVDATLVYRFINSCAEAPYGFDDLISALVPDEGLRIFIVDGKVLADGFFQFNGAAVRPALDLTLAQQRAYSGPR